MKTSSTGRPRLRNNIIQMTIPLPAEGAPIDNKMAVNLIHSVWLLGRREGVGEKVEDQKD